jgi:hypothetical protein
MSTQNKTNNNSNNNQTTKTQLELLKEEMKQVSLVDLLKKTGRNSLPDNCEKGVVNSLFGTIGATVAALDDSPATIVISAVASTIASIEYNNYRTDRSAALNELRFKRPARTIKSLFSKKEKKA